MDMQGEMPPAVSTGPAVEAVASPQVFRVRTAHGVREFRAGDGHVLPHEHVIIDLRFRWEGDGDWFALDGREQAVVPEQYYEHKLRPQGTSRENLVLGDWYVAAKELRLAAYHGCQLLVDLTTDGLSPQPSLATRAADLAGLPIVLSVGRYLDAALTSKDKAIHPESLAALWLSKIEHAQPGHEIGVIGEIGTSETVSRAEMASLVAAAITQRESKLPVNVHLHPFAKQGHVVLDILESSGAQLNRVALSHCDAQLDVDFLVSLAERGAYIEFDLFGLDHDCRIGGRGFSDDSDRIGAVGEIVARGLSDRLLLSHDICLKSRLTRFGGWGYAHLGKTILPLIAEQLGDAVALELSAVNPLRFLGDEA